MIKPRTRHDVVVHGSERLRVGPWRGDPRVIHVAPLPGRVPSTAAVSATMAAAQADGRLGAVTTALTVEESRPFLEAGFTDREHLHLLRHRLEGLPPNRGRGIRRARWTDRDRVVDVDHAAFDEFWQLDRSGLADARAATPTSRFRVADDGGVTGYAITGRSGSTGYLQRLAVDPRCRRRGTGTALVADALWWVQRRGGTSVLVNTQASNHAALGLYERMGFVRERDGLRVLEWWCAPSAGSTP